MPWHEQKICPRCNQSFECKLGDITHCQCSGTILSIEEIVLIEETYSECLCVNCLKDLKASYPVS